MDNNSLRPKNLDGILHGLLGVAGGNSRDLSFVEPLPLLLKAMVECWTGSGWVRTPAVTASYLRHAAASGEGT